MRALAPTDFLALWESGRAVHSLDQGLLALRAAQADTGDGEAADWPLGRRNQALAALRRQCFGANLRGLAACPKCAEPIEFELDCDALSRPVGGPRPETVEVSGLRFKLPTSRILASVVEERDLEKAAARLCEHCRIDEDQDPPPAADLSPEQVDQIGEAMASADPLAEIALDFECPACGEGYRENLDLAAFFWREIEVAAKRLLSDVHVLATAYGWGEAEILALSPPRRAYYVERSRQ
jgi:hypothetical protein